MKISIQNLKQGLSSFSDTITGDFIDKSYQKYYPADFFVTAVVDKIERDFRVKLQIKSLARYECDRCLKEFNSSVDIKQEQIYKTGTTDQPADEEIISLPVDAIEIDFSELLNEMILLNHPIKMLCKEQCRGICPGCGVD